jgi:hypothetical protein
MKKTSTAAVTCPRCGTADSRVVQTSRLEDGTWVRRRRCEGCGKAIYTSQPPESPVESWRIMWATRESCSAPGGKVTGLRDPRENTEKLENIVN